MSGEIASAFVRIRPNMTGFKPEVESGVRDSVQNIGKIIGGALAATTAFEFGKKLIESAAAHQAAFAGLIKSTKDVGAATSVAGQGLEQLLEHEARLKGFSDEQLAQAFLRLVTATRSSAKAFSDLGAAEDLSRARNIDLATSALAISKAVQGQTNSLQRYGIVVPHVRAAEDELAARRRAAIQDGAQFTAAQNAIYQSALKVAKAQDQQAAKTEGLRIVQQRFGGSAKTFADTAEGQFQRLQQDFHQFEAAIGTALLPGLAHAAEGIGTFVGSLAHNEAFVQEIHKDVAALGGAFHSLGTVLQSIAPTLLTVASAATHVVDAIGAPGIITAVATYKALSIGVQLAGAAEEFYARAVAASIPAATAAAAANSELAASETAVGAAGAEAATAGGLRAFLSGVGSLSLAAGGPTILATAGLAALAGAFVYVATRTDDAARAMQQFKQGLTEFGRAIQDIPTDKLDVAQARLNLRVAEHTLAVSKAKPGSAERTQQIIDEKQAAVELSQVLHRLATDENIGLTGAGQKAAALVASSAAKAKQNAELARTAFANNLAAGGANDPAVRAAIQRKETDLATASLASLVRTLRQSADEQRAQNPLVAHNIDLLAAYAATIKHIPSQHTTKFILENAKAKASIADVLAALKKSDAAAKVAGERAADGFSVGFANKISEEFLPYLSSGTSGLWSQVTKGLEAAAAVQAAAPTPAQSAATKRQQTAAEIAIKGLRQGISLDQASLADLKQQAAIQVQTSIDAITSAITQAKGSFNQIGQTIALDIQTVLSRPLELAQTAINDAGDRLALSFDRQVLRLQTRAASLSNQVNAIQVQQQARSAQFAGEDARIAQEEARIGLSQDKLNVAQLRRSVILPGGRTLSTNNAEALGQLERFAARSKGASKLAILQFVDQFRSATLSVEKDKIGLATGQSPRSAQRQADLELASSRNQLQQATISARHAAAQARLQIRADIVRIGADVAAARSRVAAQEIADLTDAFARAPSPAALKRVTKKIADIMARDHVSFSTAGRILGTAFVHGFQAQFTGLAQQGQALFGVKGAPGGGLVPAITKPLETIQQQQLAASQLAKQQRATQIDESKKQTALLRKIHSSQAASKFTNSLKKNPGGATTRAKSLAGTTG